MTKNLPNSEGPSAMHQHDATSHSPTTISSIYTIDNIDHQRRRTTTKAKSTSLSSVIDNSEVTPTTVRRRKRGASVGNYQPDRSTRRHPQALTSLYAWDAVAEARVLESDKAVGGATQVASRNKREAQRLRAEGVTHKGEFRQHVWPPAQCSRLNGS